jgi:putative nucleotidyltransferase with HDIG domain
LGKPFKHKDKTLRIANVRDISVLKKAEKVQSSLYAISETANRSKNLDDLYRSIHSSITELMPAKDNFYIALLDETNEMLNFPYFVDEYEENPGPRKLGKGLTEYVLRTKKPLLASPEVFKKLEKSGEIVSIGPPSIDWLGVPLQTNGKVIGVLAVQSYMDGVRYDEEDMNILLFISEQATMAIERMRAEKEKILSQTRAKKALEETINALASAVETRDPYTAGHQERVAKLACAIAEKMGLPQNQIEGIRMASLIHDIGKINVPAEILSRPAQLKDSEFLLIREHPKIGYEILKNIDFPWPIAQIVLQHHERMLGNGYPDGISGENILLQSKIIGIADVVEAMCSHRPYRPAKGIEQALKEILQNKGSLYDPQVVDVCFELFKKDGFSF